MSKLLLAETESSVMSMMGWMVELLTMVAQRNVGWFVAEGSSDVVELPLLGRQDLMKPGDCWGERVPASIEVV